MKIKQESSGIPKQCYDENGEVSDELLDVFISAYEAHEGVKLDKSSIMSNPGKRTVMKQILNALWGKLAQNENASIVSFIEDSFELLTLANDSSIEVTLLDFLNENLARTTNRKVMGSTTTLKDSYERSNYYISAYARLELHDVVMKLGDRVLYTDTDSLIYISKDGDKVDIKTGEFLGDLTDELNCKRDPKYTSQKWIEEFVSTGPKSYSYKTNFYEEKDKKRALCP